jgi:hypothetical protein
MTGSPPCHCCTIAQTFPAYRWFNPACLYCGARLIQHMGLLPIAASECKLRRQTVLRDWLSYGHHEAELRALLNGPPALAPGSDNAAAFASPAWTKPRYRLTR